MPTMAEYAASGGYARDAQINKNISLGPSSSSSGSGGSFSSPASYSGSGSSSSSSGGSYGTGGNFSIPAMAQPNTPSWMGNQYSQVPGTSWYSTNPSMPNATKYSADGRPVATVGYDNQQTNQHYNGYATPEQFQQITSGGNAAGTSNTLSGMLSSGQLNMPQSMVYNPSGGYAATETPKIPMSYKSDPFAPLTPGYMQGGSKTGSVNYPGMNNTDQNSTVNYPGSSISSRNTAGTMIGNPNEKTNGGNMIGNPNEKINGVLFSSGTTNAHSGQGTARIGYTKNPTVDAMPIDQQLAYYAKNPQEAQQEIARAQSIGSPEAMNWVNQLSSAIGSSGQTGKSPDFIIPQAYNGGSGSGQQGQGTGQNQGLSTQQTATPNNLYKDPYARTPDSIAALAKSRIDAILQGGRTAAQGSLLNAKNAFDYSQQKTQGDRALLQFNNSQRGDQYGGSAREDKFRLDRQQGIEDTAQNNQYTAQVAQINQKLADLESAAPGDQQKIIDELTQIERTTGISVAQLQEQQKNNQFNQSDANRKFDQQAQQQKFNQDQAVKQQHLDLANALSKQFGVPVNPTEDPMESYAQVAGIPTVEAKKLALDAANMSFDNAIKKALAENTINKSQADIMHSAQQTAIAQQNANTSAASSANSNNNANQTHLIEVWKATGKAPAGITGVAEGAPYVHAPTTQDKNQAMGKLVSDIDKMTPENRKKFFKEQTSNIIDEHGLAQYNQLHNKYLDKNGDPK